jgi:hypothetical protein
MTARQKHSGMTARLAPAFILTLLLPTPDQRTLITLPLAHEFDSHPSNTAGDSPPAHGIRLSV